LKRWGWVGHRGVSQTKCGVSKTQDYTQEGGLKRKRKNFEGEKCTLSTTRVCGDQDTKVLNCATAKKGYRWRLGGTSATNRSPLKGTGKSKRVLGEATKKAGKKTILKGCKGGGARGTLPRGGIDAVLGEKRVPGKNTSTVWGGDRSRGGGNHEKDYATCKKMGRRRAQNNT